MKHKVVQDWHATYEAPIHVTQGEVIVLNGRTDIWDGHLWLWAESTLGTCGWVPDSLVVWREGRKLARYDYSAMELSCSAGDILSELWRTHGWILCRSLDGATGWVPQANLSPLKA
ncbi:MAG: SH3 domain-containing protein [Pikeienuella sp.]